MVSWVGIGALWLAYGIYGGLPSAVRIVLSNLYKQSRSACDVVYLGFRLAGSGWDHT
jgi:hypothetical protein